MAQPLIVKVCIVPRDQNIHGGDIIRFTADYLASDVFAKCTGFYPPWQPERSAPVYVAKSERRALKQTRRNGDDVGSSIDSQSLTAKTNSEEEEEIKLQFLMDFLYGRGDIPPPLENPD